MKTIILLSYIVCSYLLIPYLFSFVGAIKKAGTMTQDELNEEELESNQLNEKETALVQKFSKFLFMILGMYLYAILGTSFGLATDELLGDSTLKWIAYPCLYILMVSSFRLGQKAIESYEIKLSLIEKILFYITMLTTYLLAIWAKESLPFILTWHWIY